MKRDEPMDERIAECRSETRQDCRVERSEKRAMWLNVLIYSKYNFSFLKGCCRTLKLLTFISFGAKETKQRKLLLKNAHIFFH